MPNVKALQAATNFDPEMYKGRWFEIAGIKPDMQRNLVCTTCTLTPRKDGGFNVMDEALHHNFKGDYWSVAGKLTIPEKTVPSRMKLKLNLLSGIVRPTLDYIVLDVDDDYYYALVGNEKYCWILARDPVIDPALFAELRDKLASFGYDVSQLSITRQHVPKEGYRSYNKNPVDVPSPFFLRFFNCCFPATVPSSPTSVANKFNSQ
uniref:Lipocalin/cytosolic fatty-acid binding domain-containing protein n=1 Tax=Cyanoptyche gloeocystis TaxID=77922 RepID=A0A7S2JQ35_9EUKA|eukprot:CAMPEP_0196660520 /NCGR_PEP_ID=MMETSP1086-20130531/40162_1 /TAXON_ID=77921 /ORGANISM="Cyanoptyche  gloeocystis , Strain SAG4.97" /LENGTH=205 /DNA_ID=CAMNT_0041994967 /DNA_START=47 /DNA_END=664 /DNA_ORIENTATION=+